MPEATIIRRSDTEMRSGFLPFWGNVPDPNFAPFNLASTANLEIMENAPVGTFVGLFVAEDQDEDAQLSFYLDTEIEDGNHIFALDENGTLTNNASFDFENNATEITLQIYVLDESSGRAEANFVVSILDVFEDMDQDGVEDHLDEDMDGDGFTNEEEIAYPSDPEDPTSMANVPPLKIRFGWEFISSGKRTCLNNSWRN